MTNATCKIQITVTVDPARTQGDEFELVVAAVRELFNDFRMGAMTGFHVDAPDDLTAPTSVPVCRNCGHDIEPSDDGGWEHVDQVSPVNWTRCPGNNTVAEPVQ